MGVEVRIPLRVRSQVHGARCHWAVQANRRRREREVTHIALLTADPPALPAVVTLARVAPRRLDDDNLRPALKSVRDQVAVWLGLPRNKRGQAQDDDPRVVWRYAQGHGRQGEYCVVVYAATADLEVVRSLRAEEEWS